MSDPYSVLGVSPTATHAEISHAYRSQLRNYHPDRRSSESQSEADERLGEILAAYTLLRDPDRRAAYDRAHPTREQSAPLHIPVTRIGSSADEHPPLWAGPVRWQR